MPIKVLGERFARNVLIGDNCWEWGAALDHAGYGVLHAPGTTGGVLKAHRVSYALNVGPIPDGMCVCHACDNPACVKPSHLFLGTQRDNMSDMCAKGRSNAGERNGRSRLTADDVRQIRRRCSSGEARKSVASDYGVCRQTVDFIANGTTWRSVGCQ